MKMRNYSSGIKPLLRKVKNAFATNDKIKHESVLDYYYYDELIKNDLIIFDDFLPKPIGSWRGAEIGSYLKHFDHVKLVCFASFYDKSGNNVEFEKDKKNFIEKYGLQSKTDSILKTDLHRPININAKLVYCLFYHNLRSIYPVLQKYNIAFLFTLFPGGDFAFYDDSCDSFLKEISNSPLLKGVIVTQQSTYDYLVDRKIFKKNQLSLIFGGCFPINKYQLTNGKKYYDKNKNTLDLCFVAGKYIDGGLDKGFDIFCHTAHKLCKKYDFIQFHIVGNFTRDDLMFEIPDNRIIFYGIQTFEWFADFYFDKDVIISPVRPFILNRGAFDGFPTGGTVDAGLYKVVMMPSDPLGDNNLAGFNNWNDIIIVESNIISIINAVEKLIGNPTLIESIAERGYKKTLDIYSEKEQIAKRLNIITNFISEEFKT